MNLELIGGDFQVKLYLRLSVFLLSFLTSAHFLRHNNYFFVTIFFLLPFLTFVKNKISFYILNIFIFISTLSWIDTTVTILNVRIKMGMPYARFTVILSIIILANIIIQILLIRNKTLFIKKL